VEGKKKRMEGARTACSRKECLGTVVTYMEGWDCGACKRWFCEECVLDDKVMHHCDDDSLYCVECGWCNCCGAKGKQ